MPDPHRLVAWLAQLPLSTVAQLSDVSSSSERAVREVLDALRDAGWLYEHQPDTHGGDVSLHALSPAALAYLRGHPGATGEVLPPWQLQVRAVAAAIVAEPVTRTLNAYAAALARAAREAGGRLVHCTLRPPSAKVNAIPGRGRPVLARDHAEFHLELGARQARFSVFCDSAALPRQRRADLFERWRKPRGDELDHPATHLIIAPNEFERSQWMEVSERVMSSDVPMAVALRGEACNVAGFGDEVWQPTSGLYRRGLSDVLAWEEIASATPGPGSIEWPPPRIADPGDAEAALRRANRASTESQRTAALLLTLTPARRRVAHLLGVQQWLSAGAIAQVVGTMPEAAAEELQALRDAGVVVPAIHGSEHYWTITDAWMHVVAARAGDARSWRSHGTELGILRTQGDEQVAPPKPHTLGVASTLGMIAAAARDARHAIEDWRGERWWWNEVDKTEPIPDAVCRIRQGDGTLVALIEYERIRGGHQAALTVGKWAPWFASERWRELRGPVACPAGPPVVLVIYDGTSTRRASMWRAIEQAPPGVPIYAATAEQFSTGGFREPIWLQPGGGVGPLRAALRE